jgi:hypothetical protein
MIRELLGYVAIFVVLLAVGEFFRILWAILSTLEEIKDLLAEKGR